MKKNEIIKEALNLFIEKGYENTSVTNIMEKVNLSKGGMYHHFSSKEEILSSVIEYGLAEEIEKLKTKIDTLSVEEKLIAFAKGMNLGSFAQALLDYGDKNKNSIVAYKIREANIHMCIPILTEILKEGTEFGIYKTEHPKEMAEFLTLLVRGIVDSNLLPEADEAGMLCRIKTFIDIVEKCLQPTPAHLQAIYNVFLQDQT